MNEQVKCPICSRRLFDIEEVATGVIAIKCITCKEVSRVRLDKAILNKTIKTTLICSEPKGV